MSAYNFGGDDGRRKGLNIFVERKYAVDATEMVKRFFHTRVNIMNMIFVVINSLDGLFDMMTEFLVQGGRHHDVAEIVGMCKGATIFINKVEKGA